MKEGKVPLIISIMIDLMLLFLRKQLASQYLKRKRSALEIALSMWEDSAEIDSSSLSVVPSVYVGQFARLLEQGDLLSMQS